MITHEQLINGINQINEALSIVKREKEAEEQDGYNQEAENLENIVNDSKQVTKFISTISKDELKLIEGRREFFNSNTIPSRMEAFSLIKNRQIQQICAILEDLPQELELEAENEIKAGYPEAGMIHQSQSQALKILLDFASKLKEEEVQLTLAKYYQLKTKGLYDT